MSSALCMGIGTMCVRAAWEIVQYEVAWPIDLISHPSSLSPCVRPYACMDIQLLLQSAIPLFSLPFVQEFPSFSYSFVQLSTRSAVPPFGYPFVQLSLHSAISPFSYPSVHLSLRLAIQPFYLAPRDCILASLGSLACCDMIRRPIYSCNI